MKKKTVVVVQRLNEFGDDFAEWLSQAGYRVQVCSGPTPPGYDCWAMQFKDCPYWSQADLLIYDPWLAKDSGTYGSEEMLTLEIERHPDKPVLIWGSGAAIPQEIVAWEKPGVFEILPMDITPSTLLATVERIIGSSGSEVDQHREESSPVA